MSDERDQLEWQREQAGWWGRFAAKLHHERDEARDLARTLRALLDEERQHVSDGAYDRLSPEDVVHRLLPEKAGLEQIKRASEAANVQFHIPNGPLVPDEYLGQDEERDRLARAFESLRRLDREVRHRTSRIFSANGLDGHGFAASVVFTYVPEWDKTIKET